MSEIGAPLGKIPRERLASLARELVPGGSLLAVRTVRGGTSALTRELVVGAPMREAQRLILRCFVLQWQGTPGEKVERERAALSALQGAAVPVPRVLWADADGKELGYPAVIQTRLPGRTWWPQAVQPSSAAAMGRALAAIHASTRPAQLPSAQTWVRWTMQSERGRGSWLGAHPRARAIEEAITSAGDRPLRRTAVLSHGDFGAGNVLWSRGRLTGVIDWETAEAAPRASDVGACLIDCTVVGGTAMAEAFLEGYANPAEDLWFWQLLTLLKFTSLYAEWLPGWRSLGMTELDEGTVRSRLDDAIDETLRRVS